MFWMGLAALLAFMLPTRGVDALATVVTAALIATVALPRLPPLVFLGLISYSLYLIHPIVGGRAVNIIARMVPLGETQQMLVGTGASIIAAMAFCYLIELPSRRWASAIRYERRRGVTAPTLP